MPSINNLFESWGRSKRALPPSNDTLKSQMLQKSRLSGSTAQKIKLPWLSFAFAGLAVIMLVVNIPSSPRSAQVPMGVPMEAGSALDSMKSNVAPDYHPYPGPGVDITDTREFLKMDYHAAIRTRDVSDLSQTIRNIVRGVDGRVDSLNITEKTGYISFAVPADKFDSFQSQIKGLVRARFITESINTQNLLPEKQSIEQQQESINAELARARTQRGSLIISHRTNLANLQDQLRVAQEDQNEQEMLRIQARINAENASYNKKLASFDAQIKNYETQFKSLAKQDQQLLNNVATVNGTIALNFISMWQIVDLYAGPYWLPIILALVALIAYWHHRQQKFSLPL